jgi:hypothetical protein
MQPIQLLVPDRFDTLRRRASEEQLDRMVVRVAGALDQFDALARRVEVAGRGGFIIVRGDSGSGKSTFLHTLNLFRNVEVTSIAHESSVVSALRSLKPTKFPFRVIVVESREALRGSRPLALVNEVHGINDFIREPNGEHTLVAWPCNTDDLEKNLKEIAERVGGDSLIPLVDDPVVRFQGPRRDQYIEIARRTIATLNEGASFQDLGISDERAESLREKAPTIGAFLWYIREELLNNNETIELIRRRDHWLGRFPEVLVLYEEAAEKHSNGVYLRNALDDLRLAVEMLLRSIFQNDKALENQVPLLGEFVKRRAGSPELRNMFLRLLDYYTKYHNTYVKHDDAVNRGEVEFIFELTSSVMKHLVRLSVSKAV